MHRLRSEIDIDVRAVTLRDESERGLGSESFSIEAAAPLENWLNAYFGFPSPSGKIAISVFPTTRIRRGRQSSALARLPRSVAGLVCQSTKCAGVFGPISKSTVCRRSGKTGSSVPPEQRSSFASGDVIFEGINPCQRCVVPPRDPLTGESDDTFVRRFTELRARTLPVWSTRERFNHFYRVAINTRTHGDEGGKVLHVGDSVEILDVPAGGSAQRAPHVADFWAGDLVVESMRDETATVKTFRLRHSSGADIPFRFLPGSF